MWNIIIGGIFIVGGLSGNYALRGTNSPLGLVLVGAGLLVWGLIQLGSGSETARTTRPSARRGGRRMRTGRAEATRQRVRR